MSGKTIPIVIAVGFILGAGGFALGHFTGNEPENKTVETEEIINSITLKEILEPASELISLKYKYTDADIYERSKFAGNVKIPFTTDKVVFTYSGIISAGFDLSEVDYNINSTTKTITIDLPEPKILSHEIDESGFKFFDVKSSVFTETKLEDYTAMMAELKTKKEADLSDDSEFFDSVIDNAQTVVGNFLTLSDKTKDYTVKFK